MFASPTESLDVSTPAPDNAAPGVTRVMAAWGVLSSLAIVAVVALPAEPSGWVTTFMAVATVLVVGVAVVTRDLYGLTAWRIFAVGLFLWVASELVLNIEQLPVAAVEVLNVGNALRLVGYLGLIIGALLLVHRRHNARDTTTVTDSLIVLAAGAGVLAWTTLDAAMSNEQLGPVSTSILAGYAIFDLVLLSVVVRLWFASTNSTNRGIRLLSAAFLWLLLADLAAQFAVATGGIGAATPEWAEVPYVAFLAVSGLAALDPDATRVPPGDSDATGIHRSRIIALLIISMLVPTAALIVLKQEWSGYEMLAVLGLTGLLTILISLRISLLLLDYRYVINRSQVLARATEALSNVETTADLDGLAPYWVSKLGERSDVAHLSCTVHHGEVDPTEPATLALPVGSTGRTLIVTSKRPIDAGLRASLDTFVDALNNAYERVSLQGQLVEDISRRRTAALLQQSLDVVALVSEAGAIEFCTPAITSLTGLTPEQAEGMPWRALFHDHDAADGVLKRSRKVGALSAPLSTSTSTGDVRHLDVRVRWLDEDRQFVATHHDVTERRELEEALRQQAFHDPLTGLANRLVFRDQLNRALKRARRSPLEFVCMMIDLDDFKAVNDTLGHPAGDELLRTVAHRLTDSLREGDTPARLGGDEFAVILENTWSVSDAKVVAQRILDRLSQPVKLGDTEVVVGASIGVAVGNATTAEADELARNADLALYRAKSSGKNQFFIYEPGMHADALSRLTLTAELREAVDAGSLELTFQPIVDLVTGGLAGFAGNLAWEHGERGQLPPAEFLPVAESSGLITKLGAQTMSRAMAIVARWQRAYPLHSDLRLSLKVTARQLADDNFVESVHKAVSTSGISASSVMLEISEGVLLPGNALTTQRLAQLTAIGMSVYIDEWGEGWSSLRHLDALHVSGLKLTESFIADVPSQRQTGMARAVLDLAGSLEMEAVIPTAVTRPEQCAALVELGYRLGQGDLLGPVMGAGEAEHTMTAMAPAPWPRQARVH